ncbi:hypothetical protein T484DRAFT_1793022 [Baffinella frigidus]|nr:hypothetical protein T484DRAFT_1793022 [Cryptophyta sp. CCMP2293]
MAIYNGEPAEEVLHARSKRRVQNAILSSAAILVVLAAILLAAARFLGKAQDQSKLLGVLPGYASGGAYGYGLAPAYTRAPAGWRRVAVAPQAPAGESEDEEWQRVNGGAAPAESAESADDEWQRVNGGALPVESAAGVQSAVREGVGAAAQLPSVLPTAFPGRALPQYGSPLLGAYVIPSQPPLYSPYVQPPTYAPYAQYYPPAGLVASAPTLGAWGSVEPEEVAPSVDAPEVSEQQEVSDEPVASSGESQESQKSQDNGGEAEATDAGEGVEVGASPDAADADTVEAEESGAAMAPGAGSTLEEESDEVAADAAKKAALKEAAKLEAVRRQAAKEAASQYGAAFGASFAATYASIRDKAQARLSEKVPH